MCNKADSEFTKFVQATVDTKEKVNHHQHTGR